MNLETYLTQLDSSETQWGLWVSPDDINDYRVGQVGHEGGGLSDGKVYVGTLESLSCGSQSSIEAFPGALAKEMEGHEYNEDHLLELYIDGTLEQRNPQLVKRIEGNIAGIHETWASEEAAVRAEAIAAMIDNPLV